MKRFDFVTGSGFCGSRSKLDKQAREIVKECAPFVEYGGRLDSESEKQALEYARNMIVIYGFETARALCLKAAKEN